jgi:hypothetical protein
MNELNWINFIVLVSKYELDEFFNRTNDQIIRIKSNQGSNSIPNDLQLEKRLALRLKFCNWFNRIFSSNLSPKLNVENVTLADICSVASDVADKMSLSKVKVFKLSIICIVMIVLVSPILIFIDWK